jgi:hypothetical protein
LIRSDPASSRPPRSDREGDEVELDLTKDLDSEDVGLISDARVMTAEGAALQVWITAGDLTPERCRSGETTNRGDLARVVAGDTGQERRWTSSRQIRAAAASWPW